MQDETVSSSDSDFEDYEVYTNKHGKRQRRKRRKVANFDGCASNDGKRREWSEVEHGKPSAILNVP